jgi:TPR repeat protein
MQTLRYRIGWFVLAVAPGVLSAGLTDDWQTCQRQVLNHPGAQNSTQPAAQYCVGLGYMTGFFGRKDTALAAAYYRKAAAQNHPGAETALGYAYEKGYGVPKDPASALNWYRKAAAQGSADGYFNLGRLYEHGIGTAPNKPEAMKYYHLAADAGSEEAKRQLVIEGNRVWPGQQFDDEGTKQYQAKNYAGAFASFQKAAQMGNPQGQLHLGVLYEFGQGVAVNYGEAFRLYTQAANAGNSGAQKTLGLLYEEGKGTPENWAEALKWYQKSADQYNADGEFALGRMYEFGMAVPQNRATAIAWFRKSGAQGNSQAAYFARWLSDPTNNIGFRNDQEHNLVIAGKLRFGAGSDDPAGIAFRNSAERLSWLNGLRQRIDQSEAMTMWTIRKNEYDQCRNNGGSNCHPPGPRPR